LSPPSPSSSRMRSAQSGWERRQSPRFVETQQGVEGLKRGDCRLSHPDCADLIRLDEGDGDPAPVEHARKARSDHPAGCAASDNHDLLDRRIRHFSYASLCEKVKKTKAPLFDPAIARGLVAPMPRANFRRNPYCPMVSIKSRCG